MKYQIGFDGAASAELTQLLHAVERQINGLGTGILASMDAQAQGSSASTAQPCDPSSANCSGGVGGDSGIGTVVVVAAVAGAIAGAVTGYVAGKKSADQVKSPKV